MIYDPLGFERKALSKKNKNQRPKQQLEQQQKLGPKDLERQQKVILLENGCFEWDENAFSKVICRCHHEQRFHLDAATICFGTKPDICLCEEFILPNRSATTPINLTTPIAIIEKKSLPKKDSYNYRSWQPPAPQPPRQNGGIQVDDSADSI
jgi:hypothetical protein